MNCLLLYFAIAFCFLTGCSVIPPPTSIENIKDTSQGPKTHDLNVHSLNELSTFLSSTHVADPGKIDVEVVENYSWGAGPVPGMAANPPVGDPFDPTYTNKLEVSVANVEEFNLFLNTPLPDSLVGTSGISASLYASNVGLFHESWIFGLYPPYIVTITKYDTVQKLVSGKFAMNMVHSEFSYFGNTWLYDTVILAYGSFTDLHLKYNRPWLRVLQATVEESGGQNSTIFRTHSVNRSKGTLDQKEFDELLAYTPTTVYPELAVYYYGTTKVGIYSGNLFDIEYYTQDTTFTASITDPFNQLEITKVDSLNRTISGKFQFHLSASNRPDLYLKNGTFDNIPW
jgi:hypothetical protein